MLKVDINIDSLNERTAGDNLLAKELLQMLKNQYDDDFLLAKICLDFKDYNTLASILHRLKSSIGTLGFDGLRVEMEKVEKKVSKNSSTNEFSSEINSIFISLKNHIIELEKILNT